MRSGSTRATFGRRASARACARVIVAAKAGITEYRARTVTRPTERSSLPTAAGVALCFSETITRTRTFGADSREAAGAAAVSTAADANSSRTLNRTKTLQTRDRLPKIVAFPAPHKGAGTMAR